MQLMSLSGVIGARDRVFSPNTGQQKQAKFSQEVKLCGKKSDNGIFKSPRPGKLS